MEKRLPRPKLKDMKSIKVVKGFFNKTSAKAKVKFEKELALENGREIVEVKVMDACQVYISNPWFKSKIREFGSPKPGQLIVVVIYADVATAGAAHAGQKSCVTNKVISFIPSVQPGQHVSPGAAKARAMLIDLALKTNSHLLSNTGNVIEFMPDYNLSIAS